MLPALGLFLPLEELFEGLDEALNVEFDLIPPAWPDEENVLEALSKWINEECKYYEFSALEEKD